MAYSRSWGCAVFLLFVVCFLFVGAPDDDDDDDDDDGDDDSHAGYTVVGINYQHARRLGRQPGCSESASIPRSVR